MAEVNVKPCPICKGTGVVEVNRFPCPRCSGVGLLPGDGSASCFCKVCGCKGLVTKQVYDYEILLKRADAAFDSLTDEEQKAHRRAQKISWVRGEFMIEHPKCTFEEATALAIRAVDRVADEAP